jgi:hypothetical protein
MILPAFFSGRGQLIRRMLDILCRQLPDIMH